MMTPATRQKLIDVWKAIESVGLTPTIASTIDLVRRNGYRFADPDARKVLSGFTPRRRHKTPLAAISTAPETPAAQGVAGHSPYDAIGRHGDATASRARDKVSTVTDTEGATEDVESKASTSPSAPHGAIAASAAQTTLPLSSQPVASATDQREIPAKANSRKPRQAGLPLNAERDRRADELLAAIWERCSFAVGRSMTQKTWRSKNISVARELADLGRSVDDVVAAHELASEKAGKPVYMLAFVQRALVDLDDALPPVAVPPSGYLNPDEIAQLERYDRATLHHGRYVLKLPEAESMRLAKEAFERKHAAQDAACA